MCRRSAVKNLSVADNFVFSCAKWGVKHQRPWFWNWSVTSGVQTFCEERVSWEVGEGWHQSDLMDNNIYIYIYIYISSQTQQYLIIRLIIFVHNELECTVLFHVCLFLFSTCFTQLCVHHQESWLYQCDIWCMSLCRWPSGMHTRSSSTQWHIPDVALFACFVFCGAAAQCWPWPPHSWGFLITHNDASQSVGLHWTSDQLVAETSTWQHITQQTNIHAPHPVGFEPTISASERPQAYALDRAATGTGRCRFDTTSSPDDGHTAVWNM